MRLSDHLDKGFWTIASNVYKAAYGLFFTIWLIAALPEKAWGSFYLLQATFIIISLLGISLAMTPYIKFYYESDDLLTLQSNALLILVVFLLIALAIVISLRYQLSHWLDAPEMETLIYYVPLLVLTSAGKLITNEIFKASHQLKKFFFSEALYFSSNIIIITALYFQRGLSQPSDLLAPMSVSFTLSSLLSLWLARKQLHWGFRPNVRLLKRMFNFGKFNFGTTGTSFVFQYADTFVVGAYLNLATAGMLGAVKIVSSGFQLYRQAMGLIAFPAFARLYAEKRKKDMKAFYEKGIYYSNVVLLAMVIGLIVFSGFIFDVIIGKYPEGADVLKLFALTGVFISWQMFGESLLYGIGKPEKPFYTRLLSGVLNLALNIILIESFGIWGAVWASILALALLAGITTYYVRREIDFTLTGIFQRRHDITHYLRKIRTKEKA